jgi:hypothetical protein
MMGNSKVIPLAVELLLLVRFRVNQAQVASCRFQIEWELPSPKDVNPMVKHHALICGLALAVSVLTLVVTYFAFYWLLVQFQTWRLGHPNPFTIGPAMDAIPFSFVTALITLWLTVREAKRRWHAES